MLRPVRASIFDQERFKIFTPACAVFAQQMFRRALAKIWYGNYQTCDLQMRSDGPTGAVAYGELSEEAGDQTVYVSFNQSVVLTGKLWIATKLSQFRCDCRMHTQEFGEDDVRWIPETAELTIGDNHYSFIFRLYSPAPGDTTSSQPQYDAVLVSDDEPGPQPAKV